MGAPVQEVLPGIPVRMQHDNLSDALAAAQSEFPDVPKTRTATVRGKTKSGSDYEYTYQYADFADVLKAVRPVLAKHGLSFSQPLRRKDGLKLHLTSVLKFGKEETIESDGLPLPEIMEPQQMGSLLSYWRRYDGCSLLGIQPDEDDDARRAMLSNSKGAKDRFQKQEERMDKQAESNRISAKDVRAFWAAVSSSGKKPYEIKAWLKDKRLSSVEEMPADMATTAIKWATSEGTVAPKDLAGLMSKNIELVSQEKAMKLLFATAKEFHMPEEDVKQACYERFGVSSLSTLTAAQLKEGADWIKEVAAAQES